MEVIEIWRYPVKSLSGARVERTVLNPGQGLPFDRRWALALPDSEAARGPGWHPKGQFAVQVKEAAMADLQCTFDDRTGVFAIKSPANLACEGCLMAPDGRAKIAATVTRHLDMDADAPLHMVEAQDIGYFDSLKGPVSILNLASVRALEEATGRSVDPLRFRMNFWIDGLEAWAENSWVGKTLHIGPARLRVTKPTGRCKATHVNPSSGAVDMDVLHALKGAFGHTDMGIYATVEDGGPVAPGCSITIGA